MSDPSDKSNEGQASATSPPESATPTGGKLSHENRAIRSWARELRDLPLPPSGSRCQEKTDPQDLPRTRQRSLTLMPSAHGDSPTGTSSRTGSWAQSKNWGPQGR
jgi:hypothetical protein